MEVPPPSPPTVASTRRRTLAALAVALAWFVVGVSLLPDYGPTWDCTIGEYPFGEALLHAATDSGAPVRDWPLHPQFDRPRAPHPDFEMEMPWRYCWPVGAFLSAVSCRIFWTDLGWIESVPAHHLPVVAMVALLLFVMVRYAGARLSPASGVAAAALLISSPRFFADAFNNLKDMPEACLYTFAILAGARAIDAGRTRTWAAAGILAGVSLAQKANALFIPFELALYAVATRIGPWRRDASPPAPRIRDVGLAALLFVATYFALSPQLWFDTAARLREHYGHVFGTGNLLVSADARASPLAALARISAEGILLALWSTPVPVLLLAAVGALAPAYRRRDRLLLVIAVAVPLGRTLLPGMTNFDGVRHFLEFMPPLALLAAGGLHSIATWIYRLLAARARAPVRIGVVALVACAALLPGATATARTHPNGCAWFNELVGGLAGAQRRSVADATDYWGNSYWQGLAWLDLHAERDAALYVPVAGHVVRASAPVRLRPDLRQIDPDKGDPSAALYVMYITRSAHYDIYTTRIDRTHAPLHVVEVDGAPILKIHRFAAGDEAVAARTEWQRAQLEEKSFRYVVAWGQLDGQNGRSLAELLRRRRDLGDEETLRQLRALLPPELSEAAQPFLEVVKESR
jgi:dolichyl-phosphate-mannose-protein mannosyltransferase